MSVPRRASSAPVARILAAAALAGLVLAACRGGTRPAAQAPVPRPDLGGLTPKVRAIVEERREAFDAALRQAGATAVRLVEAYGAMGRTYHAANLWDAAEACYLNAQALDPGEFRWPHYLGHVYTTSGRPDRAIASFERALAIRPGDPAALVWLGRLQLEEPRLDLAESSFDRVLAADASSAAALYGLGRIALERGDAAGAARRFEAALAAAPGADLVHYSLAMAYRRLGDAGRAEAHLARRGTIEPLPRDPLFEEVLRSLPDPKLYKAWGETAYGAGRFAEAAGHFRRAAEWAPEDPFIRLDLGMALAMLGDQDGALAEFQATLRLAPDNARALVSLGAVVAARGSSEEALAHYARAVELDPEFAMARLFLGDALRAAGRHLEALAHFARAVTLDPRNAEARLGEALSLIDLGRNAEARRKLEEAGDLLPDRPVFAHGLARLLATCPDATVREGARSLALAERLFERGGAEAAQTLAMALAEVGRHDEAARLQRSAVAEARAAGRDDLVRRLEQDLVLYEGRRPCRSFFLSEESVLTAAGAWGAPRRGAP